MAEEKKSFVLYVDLIHTIRKLPDDKAGALFKHILRYVNDENPITDDFIVDLTFEPIKNQFKRDLKKWEKSREDKSYNGRLGNLKRYNTDLYDSVILEKVTLEEAEFVAKTRRTSLGDSEPSHPIAKLAVNVSVNDNVTVNVNDTSFKEKETIEFRKSQFVQSISDFKEKYKSDMLNEFYRYWVLTSKKDESLMAFEAEKKFELGARLATWFKKSKNNGSANSVLKNEITLAWSEKFKVAFIATKAKDNGVSMVISSLDANIKARSPEMAQNDVDIGVINTWKSILQKWSDLEPFLQKQISFDCIARNLDNILIQLNGSGIASKSKNGIDPSEFRRPQY